uniref:Uncharacterized protein n=1 Tax=Timema cristinae TaxID=61476 RepID=A0A7R9GX31_TIMCR|nr:unnamed protein product [Timema cristinae]
MVAGERRGVASRSTKVSFRANKNRQITETVDDASYRTSLAEKSYAELLSATFCPRDTARSFKSPSCRTRTTVTDNSRSEKVSGQQRPGIQVWCGLLASGAAKTHNIRSRVTIFAFTGRSTDSLTPPSLREYVLKSCCARLSRTGRSRFESRSSELGKASSFVPCSILDNKLCQEMVTAR